MKSLPINNGTGVTTENKTSLSSPNRCRVTTRNICKTRNSTTLDLLLPPKLDLRWHHTWTIEAMVSLTVPQVTSKWRIRKSPKSKWDKAALWVNKTRRNLRASKVINHRLSIKSSVDHRLFSLRRNRMMKKNGRRNWKTNKSSYANWETSRRSFLISLRPIRLRITLKYKR